MSYNKIGIIGLGVVGGVLYEYLKTKKHELYRYDKFKKIGSVQEINQAEVVFVCVPTPFDKDRGFDVSIVKEVVSFLSQPKIIVIRSTVLPGTTESLQKEFPQHKFLMNPEFLREANALRDMLQPERQLIGYTKVSQDLAPAIMSLLPPAPYNKILPSTAAELIKYFNNIFLATKVILANEIYDLCQQLGINYEAVAEAVAQDSRIGPSHLKVDIASRGYGGHCLPKDVASLARLTQDLKLHALLIQAVNEHNHYYHQPKKFFN